MNRRVLRIVGTLAVTGLCTAYVVWKIDIGRTAHILAHARLLDFLGALALTIATVWPMTWRWRWLLRVRGIHDRFNWLLRAYFVSYTAGQVLPTAVGGDAVRIYETTKRHPGQGGSVAGSILLERALGGATTLVLAAVGFALALGRYHVGAYLWIELAFVLATIVFGVVLFSRRLRGPLARLAPLLARVRAERPIRAVYESMHAYRNDVPVLLTISVVTLGIQAVRVVSIWLAGKAVGVDGISVRPYFVLGPLLFLVMLVPFTINGLAVRESFFVSFLADLHVDADKAFATGFLFFVVTIGLALPGAAVLAWESLRGGARASIVDG